MTPAARTPPALGPAVAIALLAGVACALALPRALPAWASLPVLLVGVAGWWRGGAARVPACVLAGIAWAALHAAWALSLQVPAQWTRHEATVTARIVELPRVEARRTAFEVEVTDAASMPELRGKRVRVAWYDDFGLEADPAAPRMHLRAGETWRLPLRVRAPRGLRNPGGVDTEKHAMAARIAASGYVHDPARAVRVASADGIAAWRDTMARRMATGVPAASSRFVRALALGDVRGLTDDDWHVLRANGLTHLVAISGFHVGLVAGFVALLARALWWAAPALGRAMPRQVACGWAAVAGAAGYAAVAGFALPTVRTVLMIAVVALARGLRRNLHGFDALALAALAVLVVDPLAVLGAGFWLSFAGVAWLLWCLPAPDQRPLHAFASAQGVATVGLLPLSAALFGQASWASPVANIVAVPWWSLVVVPLALAGVALEAMLPGAGAWAWRLSAWCFDLAWPLFTALAGSGLALSWLAEPHVLALPLAVAGAFWLLLPRGVPGRALAVVLMLALLWPDRRVPAHGEVAVTVVDVGQGLSVLVRTRHHALLYDMGPAVEEGFDAGERAVLPTLRARGVARIDRAVVSHGDADHAGGWDAVRGDMPVVDALAPPDSDVPATRACTAGQRWAWDGVVFRVLHPPPDFPYLANESSCVLRVEGAHGVVLLTGDIGEVIESRLLAADAAALRADVVLVAHHGSRSSSLPAFVAATGARHAIVSTGFGNRFGHPRREVMARWHAVGARAHDTAAHGALDVRIGAGGVEVDRRRATHRRPWDAQARQERGSR